MSTKNTPGTEIVTYGMAANGSSGQCASSFDAMGCWVLVTPHGSTTTDEARRAASELAGNASAKKQEQDDAQETVRSLCAEVARLRTRLAEAESKVPPGRPETMLSRGFVRFSSTGVLWVLSRRERGFGEFGFRFDGWDDLFRRLDVIVVESGRDAHGDWWAIENSAAIAKARGA